MMKNQKVSRPQSLCETDILNTRLGSTTLFRVLLGLATTSACSQLCYAEQGGALHSTYSHSVIEEIIVTAQKREHSGQTTPVALTAITSESLKKAFINSATDLNGISPSLNATLGNGQLQLTMRGVGNEILTSGIGEAGVAIHSNGVYLGSNVTPALGFFDLARVEILRGPQGTLWGRNSTGGAVNIIQNRPTNEMEGSIDIGYESFNTMSLEGVVSGPLSSHTQGRLALKHRGSDGYIKNLSPGGDDFGDDNSLAARASLNVDLENGSTWLLAAGYGDWDINARAVRQEGTAFPEGTLHPIAGTPAHLSFPELAFGPTTQSETFKTYGTDPDLTDELDSYYLTSELTLEFSDASLTLVTDYREYDRLNQSVGDFTLVQIEPTGSIFEESLEEFSQEIRLASKGNDKLSWVTGLYYYQQKLDSRVTIPIGPFPGVPDILLGGAVGPDFPKVTIDNGGVLDVQSVAVFGQSTYRVSDRWAATVGMRYSWDTKKSDEFSDLFLGNLNGVPLATSTNKFDEDWADWTGKLGIEYSATDHVFIFSNISKGYKSGGINIGVGSGPFDPETLWNYEIGLKSTIWEGRLKGNVTAYYSDFSDYQLQSIDGFSAIITSGDAEITGIEVEIDMIPAESWLLKGIATWTDSKITSFADDSITNPSTGAPVSTGQALPRAPEFSYRLSLEKIFSIDQSNEMFARLTYTWQDDVNLDSFGTYNASQKDYGLLDATVGWTSADSRWTVDLYGRNLTNEYYKTSGYFYAITLGSALQAQIGAPRTYGARIRYEF